MRDQDSHWNANPIATTASARLRRFHACHAQNAIAGMASHQIARFPAS